jgi:S-adenosylmethionine hydrolase
VARITLLTDFGTADGYVAAMKGVLAAEAPLAAVDDAAHDIPPGDIAAGAWTLVRYGTLYPPGSVHVVVIDPGVGSERRALAAEIAGRFYVAPDNGVLSGVLDNASNVRLVAIRNPAAMRSGISRTFHGRDIFAPAAAWLARGESLEGLGPAVSDPVLLKLPQPSRVDGAVVGEVVHVDRFGNLITNIPEAWAARADLRVQVEGRDAGPLRAIYGDVAPGQVLALIGSAAMLEIAVRDGSAAAVLEVGRGSRVVVAPVEKRRLA